MIDGTFEKEFLAVSIFPILAGYWQQRRAAEGLWLRPALGSRLGSLFAARGRAVRARLALSSERLACLASDSDRVQEAGLACNQGKMAFRWAVFPGR
jgi:hypothetical protein